MRFSRRMQGAVSIFLVIVLVPMLTVSALFVDAGKLRLGRSVAESAGDLALNTALTNYDTTLKDIYGLFATAQDMDDLFARLEDYYRASITSSGVDADTADTYTQQILAQLGMVEQSGDVDDFLNISLVDFTAQKKEDASLDNAVVMKKQIVDFMKYRSPINTGLSFINALQSFTTLAKQTELVEDRQAYYQAENEVMQNLYKAWEKICEYEKNEILKTDVGNGKNYFEDMQYNLDEQFYNDYNGNPNASLPSGISETFIVDIYGTAEYLNYQFSVYDISREYPVAEGSSHVEYTKGVSRAGTTLPSFSIYIGSYDVKHAPNVSDLEKYASDFYDSFRKYEANRSSVETFYNKNGGGDIYDLRLMVELNRQSEVDLQGITTNICSLYGAYQKFLAAYLWLEHIDADLALNAEETPPVNGSTILYNSQLTYKDKNNAYYTESVQNAFANMTADFNRAMTFAGILKNISDSCERYLSNEAVPTNQDQNLGVIANSASKYAKDLDDAAKALEDASALLDLVLKSLDGGTLSKAKQNWKTAAEASEIKSTTMAKQDLAEIDQLGKYFNAESVKVFKDRIDRIALNLRTAQEQVKNYKYRGTFIGDIKDHTSMETVLSGAGKGAVYGLYEKTALRVKSAQLFKWDSGNLQIDWIKQNDSYLWLHGQSNQPNLYTYMYQKFGEIGKEGDNAGEVKAKKQDETNGSGLYEQIKERGAAAASEDANAKSSGAGATANNIGSVGNLPSKTSNRDAGFSGTDIATGNDAPSKVKGDLSSMFDGLGKALKNFGESLRDKLFIADYALSMFSYDTIEKEWEQNPPKWLMNSSENSKKGETPTPKTITLVDISPANNYGYGAEVEYIIFGGSDNAGNITKAYGSIYGIRLALNLIYAFSDSEVREGAFAIATPISAATLGIIPVPLIQAAIIIAMACCESGIDLKEIKDGNSVALFKNKDTWHMSVSGMIKYAEGEAKNVILKAGMQLIDEGQKELSEILDMADDELAELTQNSIDSVKENVGAAFDTTVERYANIAIQKMTSIATKAIDEAAFYITGYDPSNPEQFRGDIIKQVELNLDTWLANEGAQGGLTQTVQEMAVNELKARYIGQVVDKLLEVKTRATDQVSAIQGELKDLLDDIRTMIERKINSAGGMVDNAREQLKQKAEEGIKEGAQQLKENLTSGMNDIFGSESTDMVEDNSTMASLLAFSYKDYMRLFLMIAMITKGGEQSVVLRIADCVQVNMCHRGGGEKLDSSKFLMSEAAAYVEINATVIVKPTLLALPIFSDVQGNPATNSAWYTFDYHGIKGY